MQSLSLAQARRVALAAQGFLDRRHVAPDLRTLSRTLRRTGVLQIDSVNVLQRAHYVPLFSRMGPYDTALLDRASGKAPRRLVEYWAHVAAFMPVDGSPWRAWVFGLVALLGAGLTAFYMSRLFFMTFEGEKRWSARLDGSKQHPHEAPKLMTVPMIVLAVGSIAIGFVLQLGGGLTGWLEPVTGHVDHEASSPVLPVWLLVILTLALVIAGVVLAWRQYAMATVPITPPVTEASLDESSFAGLGDVVRDERGVRFSRESDD